MEFVGISAGTAVKVQAEKNGLEVVNSYELDHVTLGRQFPLQIYLAAKGQLAIAQTELYNISKAALFAKKDSMIVRLRSNEKESQAAIAELQERFGRAIADLYEAEQLLNEKMEEMEKRLPEFAQNLAAQNLDFASDQYIEAYEQFEKGNIEKVIEILDATKLDQSYRNAVSQNAEGKRLEDTGKDLQEKAQLQIIQVTKSYDLKAESFNLLFKYASAAQLYDSIIEIHKTNKFNEAQLAINYSKAALAYYNDGKYDKALKYAQIAIGIQEKILDPMNLDLAASYNDIAVIHQVRGEYKNAREYYWKSIIIRKEILGSRNLALASSYNNIAVTYRHLSQNDTAIKYHQKAIEIQEELLNPKHYDLATSYSNIALAYQALEKYEKALEYQLKDTKILKEILDSLNPNLALSYGNIAVTYNLLGKNDSALQYHQKAIDIQEKVLNPKHPSLANSYCNIATTYHDLSKYEKALEYNQKSIDIREEILDSKHPDLAISYNNIAIVYEAQGNYEMALQFNKKSIIIREEILDPLHPDLAASYNNIASVYLKKGDYDTALVYYKRTMVIFDKTLKGNSKIQSSLIGISETYILQGENDSAKIYLDRTGWSSYVKALTLNNLGSEKFNKNQYLESIKLCLYALAYSEKSDSHKNDILKIIIYQNLAEAYCFSNNKSKAIPFFDKALSLCNGIMEGEIDVKRIQKNYEKCLRK